MIVSELSTANVPVNLVTQVPGFVRTQGDGCMDVSYEARKINDSDGAVVMQSVSKCVSSAEYQSLDTSQRDLFIEE